MERATFDLVGATCTSCSIAVEHMGRRIKGVEEIEVDRQTGEIHMDFDGNPATIDKIINFVQAIGYDAHLKNEEPVSQES